MNAVNTKKSLGVAQVILFLSIAVLVIVVAFPVLLILFNAFWVEDHFNFAGAVEILKQPETYQALVNSLIIAGMSTVGSTIVGTFFAWLVTRTDLPHKKFMKGMFLVPFMLPSFIGAMAWKMLLSPNAGFINQFFVQNFGFTGPIFNIYSYVGISAVEVMYLFPFVFIQVCGALERMDPTLEESARISGAGLFTITRKITIPLVLPSILSGALLIMLYTMAHFGTVAVSKTAFTIFRGSSTNVSTRAAAPLNPSAPEPCWRPCWSLPPPSSSGCSGVFSTPGITRSSAARASAPWS